MHQNIMYLERKLTLREATYLEREPTFCEILTLRDPYHERHEHGISLFSSATYCGGGGW